MQKNMELVGDFGPFKEGIEQIEGLITGLDNAVREDSFGENAVLEAGDFQITPDVVDDIVTFGVESWHTTTGVEFTGILQRHNFSFILRVDEEDMIATAENGSEYTLTTRQALYVNSLAQVLATKLSMGMHTPGHTSPRHSSRPHSRHWPPGIGLPPV